jgi:hypothetical protein
VTVRTFCARCGTDLDAALRCACSAGARPRSRLLEVAMEARELVSARGDGDIRRALVDVLNADAEPSS